MKQGKKTQFFKTDSKPTTYFYFIVERELWNFNSSTKNNSAFKSIKT